jgi:HlyD family secretion protein
MKLFPPEIIEYTTEFHFAKHNKGTQIIYVVVLLILFIGIGVTPFIKVKITTQSRGIIRSPLENNVIQSAVYGELKKVNLSENSHVVIGDTLLIINSEKINEQVYTYSRNIERNQQFIKDLKSIINSLPQNITTPKYLSEYNEYYSQLKQQELQSEYLLQEKNVSDELFEKKVETEMDHLKIINNYGLSIKKEKLIHDQYEKQWNAALAQLQLENSDLRASIVQLKEEQRQYVITAPITGTIIQYSGVKVGNFISPTQEIAQISPSTDLLAECYVEPSDIGFFHEGMKVIFQLDAFNYNQWGMASGMVSEISSDIIAINNQPVFKVRCSLNEKQLKLKNGYSGELKKGMTFTGRFSLTERTLSQLLFDKVDDWLNPKLVSK